MKPFEIAMKLCKKHPKIIDFHNFCNISLHIHDHLSPAYHLNRTQVDFFRKEHNFIPSDDKNQRFLPKQYFGVPVMHVLEKIVCIDLN